MKWRGKKETGMEISEDLFRLLAAWTDMSREEAFTAEVALGVECSPVSLHESVKYERSMVEGGEIGCIRNNDLAVCFSGGSFCDQNGMLLNERAGKRTDRPRATCGSPVSGLLKWGISVCGYGE